jgi:hypothetical protein
MGKMSGKGTRKEVLVLMPKKFILRILRKTKKTPDASSTVSLGMR